MSAVRSLSFVFILLISGCVSNLSEDGGPCPCGPGWKCCGPNEVDGFCIRQGDMCLTDDQKLLLALKGTWIGTAAEARTMRGTKRIVMEMYLPATGEPTLEGLTGGIWFGDEIDTRPVDPEFPRIDEGRSYWEIRDGFKFTLLNMDLLYVRLLAEFDIYEQWKEFCEAQTEVYSTGGDAYTCTPSGAGWWSEEGEGPNGEQGTLHHGPNGEEVFLSLGKKELCDSVCVCDSFGCTEEIGQATPEGQLDLAVDVDSGVIIGTGSEGSIEAIKQ